MRLGLRIAVLATAALLAIMPRGLAAAQVSAADPQRQILVMVRHPADHYRPSGAYGGGYDDALARSARERLARRIARDHGLALVDDWPMPMIGMDCFVMSVPADLAITVAAEQVAHDADVAWAEPAALFQAQGEATPPNDPLFAAQPAAREWQLADLHRIATGKGVRVAVIDSGIDARHPDLAGQLIVNRNFVAGQAEVAEQHGTGVAGVIAAKADNRAGIAGVAPQARLLGLRACWQGRGATGTLCDTFSLAKALYFAIDQKADVINLSLSGPDDRLLRELVSVAMARGQSVVAAYDAHRPGGGFPASVPGVIDVSDLSFAASPARVYTAPGRDVPTTQPGGRWFLVNGSSYSAAHVSGLAALVRQRHRAADFTLISSRPGGGAIDACATLVRAVPRCECSCGDAHPRKASSAR